MAHEADGRIGTLCIYEARDGESIREHAQRVGMPGEEFYKIATTVVVRADPVEKQIAAEGNKAAETQRPGALARPQPVITNSAIAGFLRRRSPCLSDTRKGLQDGALRSAMLTRWADGLRH